MGLDVDFADTNSSLLEKVTINVKPAS